MFQTTGLGHPLVEGKAMSLWWPMGINRDITNRNGYQTITLGWTNLTIATSPFSSWTSSINESSFTDFHCQVRSLGRWFGMQRDHPKPSWLWTRCWHAATETPWQSSVAENLWVVLSHWAVCTKKKPWPLDKSGIGRALQLQRFIRHQCDLTFESSERHWLLLLPERRYLWLLHSSFDFFMCFSWFAQLMFFARGWTAASEKARCWKFQQWIAASKAAYTDPLVDDTWEIVMSWWCDALVKFKRPQTD